MVRFDPRAAFGMRNGVVRVYLNITLRDNLCVHSVFPHLRLPPVAIQNFLIVTSARAGLNEKQLEKPTLAIFSLLSSS